MRLLAAYFLILISCNIHAQKKYDCSVYLKVNETQTIKLDGYLHKVNDLSVVIGQNNLDTIVSWKDLVSIKFRKHNGFTRTVLPIILAASASATVGFAIRRSSAIPRVPTTLSDMLINTAVVAVPSIGIYFLTRNISFKIKDYHDFINFKEKSRKYIINQ